MKDDTFMPLLTTTDWNEEWKRLQTARKRADDADEGAFDGPESPEE